MVARLEYNFRGIPIGKQFMEELRCYFCSKILFVTKPFLNSQAWIFYMARASRLDAALPTQSALLEHALLAKAVGVPDDVSLLPTGWELVELFLDASVSLAIAAYRKEGTLCFSCRGTADFTNVKTDIGMVFGIAPSLFEPAKPFVERLMGLHEDADVVFTGHSLGATVSTMLAVFYRKPAWVFEAPGAWPFVKGEEFDSDYNNITNVQVHRVAYKGSSYDMYNAVNTAFEQVGRVIGVTISMDEPDMTFATVTKCVSSSSYKHRKTIEASTSSSRSARLFGKTTSNPVAKSTRQTAELISIKYTHPLKKIIDSLRAETADPVLREDWPNNGVVKAIHSVKEFKTTLKTGT